MNSKDHVDFVKSNFEKQAHHYDSYMRKIIPYFDEMLSALVMALPFDPADSFELIDLGVGTGNVTIAVKNRFPNAKVTCLDFSEEMLKQAKEKLSVFDDITFIKEDFNQFVFPQKYDVVLTSLALHHIATDEDKAKFVSKVFEGLKDNGLFYQVDVIKGANPYLYKLTVNKWSEFMLRTCSPKEIETTLARGEKEDIPATLMNHLHWLEDAGFKEIDVIWKYYYFAVFGGVKTKN